MRVFLAGATGVIGIRLVPLLIDAGHEVTGMTRSPRKLEALEALGARAVVCDVYDPAALSAAVGEARAQAVIHQLTDLPDDPSRIGEYRAANDRIRTEGTRNLIAAARAADASRLLVQSIAWEPPGSGAAAVREHERAVLEAGGVVVRYGQLYGPGTYYETGIPDLPRIHVDEAARRTVPLLDAPTGVVELVEG